MPRKKSPVLTESEHRIMEVLWQKGAATVAEVAEALAGKNGAAYTTVLTFMRILRAKGYLSCRKQGRAYVFSPRVDRHTAARKAVRHLLAKFFAGSPEELVLSFLRDEDLTPDDIEQLTKQIQKSNDSKK